MTNYCSSCGNAVTLPAGQRAGFCGMCGVAVKTEVTAIRPRSKKVKLIAAVAGFSAAAAVLVFVAVAFILPTILLSSYQRAEMNFFSSIFGQFGDGVQYDISLGFTPGRDAREIFGSNVEDFSISGTISVLGEQMLAEGTLTSGRDSIDAVFAMNGAEMNFGLPGITQYFIRFLTDPNSFGNTTELNRRQFNRTMRNIVNEYFRLADSIAIIESGVSISGGNVTLTANQHTMNFRENEMLELLIFALREVQNNRNLMNWLDDNFGNSRTDIFDEIDRAIFYLEDELFRSSSNDVLFRMTVWINRGQIVQRRIDRFIGAPDIVLLYSHLVSGNSAYFELSLRSDSLRMSVTGNFDRRGGRWDGSGRVTATEYWRGEWDELMSVRFAIENFRNGRRAMEGTFTVTMTETNWRGNEDGFRVIMTFTREGRAQGVEASLQITDDGNRLDVGILRIVYAQTSIRRINMPNWHERNAVVVGEDSSAWRDMYDDIGRARQSLRGSGLIYYILDDLQWTMRNNWFWQWDGWDWYDDWHWDSAPAPGTWDWNW